MKKFLLLLVLSVVWLVGCQDDSKEEKSFILEESIKKGDVIVVNTAQSMPNTYKIYQLGQVIYVY